MRKVLTPALLAGVLALLVSGCETEKQRPSSSLIVNAKIYDGSGNDVFDGNSGSVTEFNETFEAAPAAVNIASFAAHNSIRQAVMGDDSQRFSTNDEIEKMSALIAADMQAGALGLSTGLEYEPGIFSSAEEVLW